MISARNVSFTNHFSSSSSESAFPCPIKKALISTRHSTNVKLPYESPWLILFFHLMSGLFVSQPPFPFQVLPDLEWNQDSADLPGELLRPLTHLRFLLLPLGRLFLLALPFLLGTPLLYCGFHPLLFIPSLWSPSFSPRCGSHLPWLSPLSRSGALDWRLCSFSFWQRRLSLSLFTISGPGLVELPGFWGSMVFRHAPIPGNGSITTAATTNVKRTLP